jgi:hypothetical protein
MTAFKKGRLSKNEVFGQSEGDFYSFAAASNAICGVDMILSSLKIICHSV